MPDRRVQKVPTDSKRAVWFPHVGTLQVQCQAEIWCLFPKRYYLDDAPDNNNTVWQCDKHSLTNHISCIVEINITHQREGRRKEAICVYYMRRYGVRYTFYMFTKILTHGHQNAGHYQNYECPSIMQFKYKIVDDYITRIEFQVWCNRTEGVQHFQFLFLLSSITKVSNCVYEISKSPFCRRKH